MMLRSAVTGLVVAGCLSLAVHASVSLAATEPPKAPIVDDNNPYLELYKLRVLQAEQNVERQRSLADLAQRKLARARRLIASQAISQEEYEVLSSESVVANADGTLAIRKVDEAKAYLRIVEALVKRGIAIPLCTYETE